MLGLVEAGADVLAMPCNTAHSPAILDVALQSIAHKNVSFVHIISSAVDEVCRISTPASRIGLLATVATLTTELYQKALLAAKRIPVVLDPEDCQKVQDAISNDTYGIKAHSNPVTATVKNILEAAAEKLAHKGIDVLLLGCTEIPLALTEKSYFGIPTIDATKTLARAVVKAIAPEKLKA